jgi:LysM domain.
MHFVKCATICLGVAFLAASAYVVKKGDTLWDLSDEFLNDPFAWPDLWENTGTSTTRTGFIRAIPFISATALTQTEKRRYPASAPDYPCAAATPDSSLPKA